MLLIRFFWQCATCLYLFFHVQFQISIDSLSPSAAACDQDETDADADFELVYKRYLSAIPSTTLREKAINQVAFQYLGKRLRIISNEFNVDDGSNNTSLCNCSNANYTTSKDTPITERTQWIIANDFNLDH